MSVKELNCKVVEKTPRPVKILQFGEGNFLRAFADWMIDKANEAGVINTDVAVVTPRFSAGHSYKALKAQDGLYNVVLEGIADGKPKRETRLVRCIAEVLAPSLDDDRRRYEEIILSPELRFVISNTTEAGIRYEADSVSADIPATFPGKVTKLLYERFRHFNGDPAKGLIFICCELIEDNSTTLRKFVLRHADENGLGDEFKHWIETGCVFVDSLVDRIVPGFPKDNIDEVKAELGYDDNAVVKGELYHLWAIGGAGYEKVKEELPLDRAGLHVLFLPGIKEFRDKKVRILNGSHTGMVPISLQLGCETVMDAFNNAKVNRFINGMVEEEVLPTIDEDRGELRQFAASILERFYNPYIKHYLKSIALNSLSKWEARNYPVVRDTFAREGKLARREIFTLAALLALYSPATGFVPEDNAEHIAKINELWNAADLKGTVEKIINSEIFTENFEKSVPGISALAASYLESILKDGMDAALTKILEK